MSHRVVLLLAFSWATVWSGQAAGPPAADDRTEVLRRENLVAWCIVPFDAKERTPTERAAMLNDLGLRRCAYDWRQRHVPTFEQEILAYREHGIEFFAFWGVHDKAFALFQQYDLHPQIWQTLSEPEGDSEEQKVDAAAQQLLPLARRTGAMQCPLGLYNHGGWGGQPENLVAVCRRLRELGHAHVGIVYNFHHGHEHIDDWAESLALMKPYLLCLNLNGMNDGAEPKILGIGKGEHERAMIREVVESGYDGPIGILDHRPELDARKSLQENLEGLRRVREKIGRGEDGQATPDADGQATPDDVGRQPPARTHSTVDASRSGRSALAASRGSAASENSAAAAPYSRELAARLAAEAQQRGDAMRGAKLFASAKLACLSCHRIGRHGGTVGPELSSIGRQRDPRQIVESVLWPQREVEPEFVVWKVLTTAGEVHTGYKEVSSGGQITLRDPASGDATRIAADEVEAERIGNSPMPAELTAGLSPQQKLDLICFLGRLGRGLDPRSDQLDTLIANMQRHAPVAFPYERAPLAPERRPHAAHPVNRDRVYDFYTKQAEHFRRQDSVPMLLSAYPGLDGPDTGHWGNQSEEDWADGRWNDTRLGSVQAGVFRADRLTVPRGVCVRLGGRGQIAVCFNPDTLTYDAVWTGGFVGFSEVRHGFLNGLQMQGRLLARRQGQPPEKDFAYHGFYRHGKRVVFSYRIGDVEYLDAPWVQDGKFVREVAPADQHSMRFVTEGGPAQWPEVIETAVTPGKGRPFAIDTIALPHDNPWNALLFCGGHDFLSDGSALVCTMQGDVWRVSGLDAPADQPATVRWRRFASGLHHPLGLVVADDGSVYVQCRDQLTRLVDLNDDGEADFYECFSNAFETSPAGHDFICGLQRDEEGNFYTASGNQGLIRISSDGQRAEVLATGFRNPDGLGLLPDGALTVPGSEGRWTPASMICAVPAGADRSRAAAPQPSPHYGYPGPRDGQPPELPLAYLPRGLDNSSGGQTVVDSEWWGPLQGQLLHFSFGRGAWFVVLRDEVDGQSQGAVVPMAGEFRSGAHRGRFHPHDGHLYVSGMSGWGSYTPDDGCFQRVRYTGDALQVPVDFHVHENGVRVTFAEPVDREIAADVESHFAQCWNYRYSGAYGSPEFSRMHPGVRGHDAVTITSAHVLSDGRSVFLEIPDLQPVNQLHLRMHVDRRGERLSPSPAGDGHDLFVTVHRLDEPFENFPGYRPREKTIAAHPLLMDLALSARRVPNPWRHRIEGARPIEIETGQNLTYATDEFRVRAGEPIALTLSNPDVVPHNWVLAQPGSLSRVGKLANRLIADPEAFIRGYIPETDAVLVHTDVVPPGEQQTISFKAPETPGRYPFLCTFPGHWMVMNGVMVVR